MACQNQIQKLEQSEVSVPTEVVEEILSRLPVVSVLRFKSVCKLWHSLISDPYFVKSKHMSTTFSTTTNIIDHRLIFSNKWRHDINICNLSDALYDKSVSNKVLTFDNPFELSSECAVIAASCNGLVCFYDEVDYKSLFIWNPTTRVCNRISLGFYLSTYGFGYDESTDDYKFLAIRRYSDPRKRRYFLKTRIYSMKTGKWNTVGDFPDNMSWCYGDGKYSNGALHWMARRNGYARMILSFHLGTETYGEVLQPDYHDSGSFDLTLGALGEELCMFSFNGQTRSKIWVMKVYGVKESWTHLFSITDHGIKPRYRTPLLISNDGKILFEEHCCSLFVYDTKKGSSSEIQNFKFCGKLCTFVESLVSPMPESGLDNNNDDPWENLSPVWHSNSFD